ncbi:MAG: M90 family metallopeptidase [Betaproteobacteria bacterium]
MFDAIRKWRRERVLRKAAIPETLWREALESLPFLTICTEHELERLRVLVVLFLDAKGIVGAGGHHVTPLQRVIIALQACVLILNLDLAYYDGWESVIVYPDEFVPGLEWEDDAGVVHRDDGPLAGEAMPRGPVVLSWHDVEASADWKATGMNLVVHEFAHKLDMRSGDANGCPPLPSSMSPKEWQRTLSAAFEHFRRRVDAGARTVIDPYAAENPAEFFAVLSEVFFAEPALLKHEYPDVYGQFRAFYRQDPATRAELLLEDA